MKIQQKYLHVHHPNLSKHNFALTSICAWIHSCPAGDDVGLQESSGSDVPDHVHVLWGSLQLGHQQGVQAEADRGTRVLSSDDVSWRVLNPPLSGEWRLICS